MEMFCGFRLSTNLGLMAKEWTDWSDAGLRNMANIICASIALRLIAAQQCRANLGYPSRYSAEFLSWAVAWLSAR